ncbi:MAG: glycosyltransferase family 2 protein [Candidatus Ryanbacteria bacterium]|nr:glycosyltransferase family 2 protein [Candidatus Ryanbacteria bacterium]
MKISIIIPVYNEAKTISRVVMAVRAASFGAPAEREIIVVDDGSSDGTGNIISSLSGVVSVSHAVNQGKGAAVKTGMQEATGDFVLIQDADEEYDVGDYPKIFKPLFEGRADVVFGNRFHGEAHTVRYFRNYVGNKFLTFLSNACTGVNLGDIEVGYKAFRKEVIDAFKSNLQSKRFGIEPELVARVARGGWRVAEVPVNYYGRTYEEGKKIGVWDGIKAIVAIIYFNFFARQR